jgi:hypothetical protein
MIEGPIEIRSRIVGPSSLNLLQCQTRPIIVSNETYQIKDSGTQAAREGKAVERDLLQCQKRPTTVSKETYYSVKRDLLQCQKGVERDLLQCQTRPIERGRAV